MDMVVASLPIVLLIWLMTKSHPVASHIALPVTGLVALVIQWGYFQADGWLLSANTLAGILAVATPISIVAGAIFLNRALVISGKEAVLGQWLKSISPNPVAQVMIIGWAFAFMLEGASGFGTPAAIAAPILVGLGFAPIPVALLALVMNSVPVSFGAVGTPTWFGFAALELSADQLLEIGQQTALIHLVAALVVPILALRFVLAGEQIRRNLVFIFLSILSCTVPYWLLAQVNYEFPALLGGALGLLLSIVIAKRGIGLQTSEAQEISRLVAKTEVWRALSPFLLVIVILLITRIEQLGIKPLLNDTGTWLQWGEVSFSQGGVIAWQNLLGTEISWSYKMLYVPALIPFVVTVLLLMPVLELNAKGLRRAGLDTWRRVRLPIVSLAGALVMVNAMMQGGDQAPVFIIAAQLSDWLGGSWLYMASFLGALGSFFSGSATVSNLTFGGIQASIAAETGLPLTLVLALQSVGAAMGNMVCINNIIAVSTILGIQNQEGAMMKRTVIPMLVYGMIAALVAWLLL
ncbi:L-lactate permease [Maribrevibacterium harenarium]|uniref:L-lactate permease n=1 Tax=Maribrevibacterium harenarium TaxID=2589817 RepID=A0A501WII1_9GAMM|nr:L-lactate permease [Maribrevibacterium harenarium]TPE49188.1 L-lactate permease [Maribrevibacterium harenarium]